MYSVCFVHPVYLSFFQCSLANSSIIMFYVNNSKKNHLMTCRHSSPPIINNLNAHNPLSGGTESKKAMKTFLPFSGSWCRLSHESSSSLPTHCIPHIAASIVHSHIHPPTWPFHLQRQQPCFLSLFFSLLMSVFD